MNLRPYYQVPFYKSIDKGMIVAYMVTGFLVTVADYATFALVFSFINAGLFAATVTAYIVGLVVSYLLNRYWVFRKGAERQSQVASLWRYGVFLLINLGITYAMLWAFESWWGITPYIGKFLVGFFMFFWIYLGNTYFVFRGPKMGPIKL
jgi:putative flippase GtrA